MCRRCRGSGIHLPRRQQCFPSRAGAAPGGWGQPRPRPICSLFVFLHLSITSQINTPQGRGQGALPCHRSQDPAPGYPAPQPQGTQHPSLMGAPPLVTVNMGVPGGLALRPCPLHATHPVQVPSTPFPPSMPNPRCLPRAVNRGTGTAAPGPVSGLCGWIHRESRDTKHRRVLAPAQEVCDAAASCCPVESVLVDGGVRAWGDTHVLSLVPAGQHRKTWRVLQPSGSIRRQLAQGQAAPAASRGSFCPSVLPCAGHACAAHTHKHT